MVPLRPLYRLFFKITYAQGKNICQIEGLREVHHINLSWCIFASYWNWDLVGKRLRENLLFLGTREDGSAPNFSAEVVCVLCNLHRGSAFSVGLTGVSPDFSSVAWSILYTLYNANPFSGGGHLPRPGLLRCVWMHSVYVGCLDGFLYCCVVLFTELF